MGVRVDQTGQHVPTRQHFGVRLRLGGDAAAGIDPQINRGVAVQQRHCVHRPRHGTIIRRFSAQWDNSCRSPRRQH